MQNQLLNMTDKLFPIDPNCPKSMVSAVKLIFVCIGVSSIATLVDFLFFDNTFGHFIFESLLLILYLLFPYKMLRGSDVARFLFVMLEAVSLALFFTSDLNIYPASVVAAFLQIPILGYIFTLLFKSDSNKWFAGFKQKA